MLVYFNGATGTNNSYAVDEPAIFTFCKNETLDSGKIRISNVPSNKRLNLQPYDLVRIVNNHISDSDIYMLVDTVVETITCLNPKIYSYEIDLFSETKSLENIVLPNLKITSNKYYMRSIGYYLSEYLNRYGERIRVGTVNDFDYVLKYEYSIDAYNKFHEYPECPEMQWNQPTLREVINDLMMVRDCIPVIKHIKTGIDGGLPYTEYKVIDFMDLTEIKNDISSDTHINYITRSVSSEDYVSDLHVDLVNVTNPVNSDVKTYVTRYEYFPFTADSSFVTTDNAILKTQYPIYEIKSLKGVIPYSVYIDGDLSKSHTVWLSFDLCHLKLDSDGSYLNFVYEEKQWELLEEKYSSFISEQFKKWPSYKTSTLFYTRNSDVINGFSQIAKIWLFQYNFWTELADKLFDNCKESALEGTPLEGHTLSNASVSGGPAYSPYLYSFFEVEYETLEGSVIRAGKGDVPNNKRVVVDNQTNSYVDSYNQGFMEYQKANRLGNLQLQINARYLISELEDDQSDIKMIEIGDYYKDDNGDENVIYQCQYQVFSNHIEVNALATKNYILRNYFTGVKSKIRSWTVASASEALTRHEVNKFYLEFSYNYHWDNFYDSEYFSLYFSSSLVKSEEESYPLIAACFATKDEEDNYYPNSYNSDGDMYAVDLVNRIIGNSLVFTFGLKDNRIVDKYITKSDSLTDTDTGMTYYGLVAENYMYSDNYGEFDRIYYKLVNNVNSEITVGEEDTNMIGKVNKLWKRPFVESSDIPEDIIFNFDLRIHKDSQEIPYVSTQMEFCSETNDIFFGKEFLEIQKAIRKGTEVIDEVNGLKLVTSKGEFDFRGRTLPNSITHTFTTLTITNNNTHAIDIRIDDIGYVDNPQGAINYILSLVNEGECFYLVNTDNEIILALKNIPSNNVFAEEYDGSYRPRIDLYLNPLKDRDKRVYSSRSSDFTNIKI